MFAEYSIAPGGILGVIGLIALLGAIVVGFSTLGPTKGAYLALALMLLAGVSIFLWAKYFPKTKFGKSMTLAQDGKDFKSTRSELEELLGQEGIAQTDLRPGGIAKIGEKRIDVIAEGIMVSAGTALTVIKVAGNRVIVRPKTTESAS